MMDDAGGRPIDMTKRERGVGTPAPPGMPPGMPDASGYPLPPPPPAPRFGKRRIIGIVVILVLALGGTVGNALNRDAASHAKVGDCMRVNQLGAVEEGAVDQDADLDRIACTDPTALFMVGSRLTDDTGPCPKGDYIEYWERGGEGGDFKLCLTYNLAVGDCWEEADEPVRVACTAEAGHLRFKVVKVTPGVADADGCTGAAKGRVGSLTYSEPAQTLCFTAV